MILVVDNYDSFTFNLVELLRSLGEEPHVVPNDAPLPDLSQYAAAILSPGPGRPEHPKDVGICTEVLASGMSVLGVCLGFQAIAHFHGGTIELAPQPVHGLVDTITHSGSPLFYGIPARFEVVRYHSLIVGDTKAIEGFDLLATNADGFIMAGRVGNHWGVQFHPESICSQFGRELLANFLAVAGVAPQRNPAETSNPNPNRAQPRATWHRERRALSTDALEAFRAVEKRTKHAVLLEFEDVAIIAGANGEAGSLDQLEVWSSESGPGPGWFGYRTYEGEEQFFFAPEVILVRSHEVELVGVSRSAWFDETWWLLDVQTAATGHKPLQPAQSEEFGLLRLRDSHERYLDMIAECQEQIRQGETYEVCLTTQLECETTAEPLAIYAALRNAAPMRSFVRVGRKVIASVSPERYLSIRAGVVRSEPIKGTRPRGATSAQDTALAKDLATNPKDRAENLMVADLVRNDLARVGRNVRVPALFEVRTFPGVHQLVTIVEADLPAITSSSVLAAIRGPFPGGSMTGAPKQRTMEIIQGLERAPRGVYSGCIGWVSLAGEADLAMTIRTAVVESGRLTYGLGGAIIALSDPAAEWHELHTKARPLLELTGQPFPADEVVESFIVTDGQVRGLSRHLVRLRKGCAQMGIAVDEQGLADLRFPPGRWWPRVSMSAAGLRVDLRPAPTPRDETTLGIAECTLAYPSVKGPEFPLLAKLRAGGEQLLVRAGVVAETTSAAVVAFDEQGMVLMDAPRLESVTESFVVEIAGKLGISVRREALSVEALRAKQVWVVNAVHGITPVRWADGCPNDVDRQMLERFRAQLAAFPVERAAGATLRE